MHRQCALVTQQEQWLEPACTCGLHKSLNECLPPPPGLRICGRHTNVTVHFSDVMWTVPARCQCDDGAQYTTGAAAVGHRWQCQLLNTRYSAQPHALYLKLQMTALNESPVLLLLDPTPRQGQRDLPVRLFESGERSFCSKNKTKTKKEKKTLHSTRANAACHLPDRLFDSDELHAASLLCAMRCLSKSGAPWVEVKGQKPSARDPTQAVIFHFW